MWTFTIMSMNLTEEGLPLQTYSCSTTLATTDAGDEGGPKRRIDCQLQPPQLISAPSLSPFKTSLFEPQLPSMLRVGPTDASLIDDDDDNDMSMDYFAACRAARSAHGLGSPDADATEPSSTHWNVWERDVPTLPSFYPLEQSAVYVPQASVSTLTTRITSILKGLSTVVSYDSKNAKADCRSKSHVEFRIRLYRGRGECDQGIIVEVQRRAGFDFSYYQDVRAILDAVQGKDFCDYDTESSTSIPHQEPEELSLRSSGAEEASDSKKSTGLASLRLLSNILCQDNTMVEAQDLALSSLASLTSTARMGEQTATRVSDELLCSEENIKLRQVAFSQVVMSSRDPKRPTPLSQRTTLRCLEIIDNVAESTSRPALLTHILSQNKHYATVDKSISSAKKARLNPRAA